MVVCADFPSRVGLPTPPAGGGQRYLAATRAVSVTGLGPEVARTLTGSGPGRRLQKHPEERKKTACNMLPRKSQAITSGNSSSNSVQSYLEFEQVSKSFGSNPVLDYVSFTVMRGETLCIMGRSGVGKSVCLRILMGFLKPDSGRVIAAGEDITDYSEDQLDRIHWKVTIVLQDGGLFDSLTVGDNVAFAMRERGELAEAEIDRKRRLSFGHGRNPCPA
jgi:ABC-type multidrug transport system fused ATPase/permease subunit